MPQDNISVASISPRAAKRPSRAAKVHRSGDVSYVHANAVRDNFSTDDFRLKTYAMSAALWVDHATGTLRAPWSLLAKPIAMPGKPPPRATAVRYMAELQRLGMFKLVHQGKSGGRDNNQWQFLWQCTNGTKDTLPRLFHAQRGPWNSRRWNSPRRLFQKMARLFQKTARLFHASQ